ncbi:7,8-dihydropterin-6-yl-methyl-4-(beta-D-ribofuranosyl)aminobenzene 5'-phosphate synthase [Desulfosalsimonas propionicica]|uniref:7, 8-dihydropterin-6-yl-methyl-4-(Beta-D-ribofuranosyl)aminobenzene 5'-phosphate synthase n=1 Tax=Desulfosalsimonas propionicica TaxID=332175 RepID=A0A7W0C9B6_9BACT|nr:MBL fold metallo-hydrolase [Desulfosalsimonas propionicica]MBA2881566.1 7,8-dihydropterin-6-yl-methyl-4-(beta-D-ribofuranosyl)aminobenzene 5'-phosphate synthase [Desulfosalsimonas propionicica]
MMKITILYDNDAFDKRLSPDWGFAALIEAFGRTILFDTGASGQILTENMHRLGISPDCIQEIFISHDHWDHTGGLPGILELNPVRVYVPDTISSVDHAPETVSIRHPIEIHENIYSTGTLKNIEQSMCIKEGQKVVVIAGCSHPGVETILAAAAPIGPPVALIGGLHGFCDFPVIDQLDWVCATHCTQYKQQIQSRLGHKSLAGGAGRVIEI